MRYYRLNEHSIWSVLPWQIIKIRVFVLQKQIYQSSKVCNILLMHKWQHLLINSNEAKLIAIDIICNYIFEYYLRYNLIEYNINDRVKFFLFHNIYTNYHNSLGIKNLLELIKQYIIYLCVQPEWEAKFEPLFQQEFNYQKICLYQKRLTSSIKLIRKSINKTNLNNTRLMKYKIASKYLNKLNFIRKFQAIPYIKYCLNVWMETNFISNLLMNFNYKILFTGTEWFNMKHTELKSINNIYNFSVKHYIYNSMYGLCFMKIQNDIEYIFNSISFSLRINRKIKHFYCRKTYKLVSYKKLLQQNNDFCLLCSNLNLYKLFIEQIRSIIYTQNLLEKWRIKKYLKPSKIIYLFIYKYTKFYQLFCLFLDSSILLTIRNTIIDYYTLWLKKKYAQYKQNKNDSIISNLLKRQLLMTKKQILNHIHITNISI